MLQLSGGVQFRPILVSHARLSPKFFTSVQASWLATIPHQATTRHAGFTHRQAAHWLPSLMALVSSGLLPMLMSREPQHRRPRGLGPDAAWNKHPA